MKNMIDKIKGTVIVSVQAMPSEPLYAEGAMLAMMKSVVNGGAFRTPCYRGNITNATIHSFDPFGNAIVKFQA